MNKEEILKSIMEIPKIETNNPISTMSGINVDDLMSAINKFEKVPTYDDLLRDNKKLTYKWEQLIKQLIAKFNKTQEIFYLDIIQIMEQIEKSDSNE